MKLIARHHEHPRQKWLIGQAIGFLPLTKALASVLQKLVQGECSRWMLPGCCHRTRRAAGSVDFKGSILLVADAQWQCWTHSGWCVASQLDRNSNISIFFLIHLPLQFCKFMTFWGYPRIYEYPSFSLVNVRLQSQKFWVFFSNYYHTPPTP